jgi:protease IV
MSADAIIDRRRLRRKLTFWRVAAIGIAALAILTAALMQRTGFGKGIAAPHIAKVRVEGTIVEDEDLLERLKDIAENDAVKGVIVSIDSPGGTTAGGEAIFEAVRKISEKKPVVAQVGTLAASAGYMIASATDHIVARQSSIVGSIGVIVQYPNVAELLARLGVSFEDIKSSPLKAEPSPFNTTTEPERAMIGRMVSDSYNWFVDLVDQRRPLDRTQVLALADGSVFTGRQGLANKLVDELGGEEIALKWLEGKNIGTDLDVIEWKPRENGGWLSLGAGAALIGEFLGLSGETRRLAEAIQNQPLFLDGLVSVWHPAFNNTKE